MLSAKYPSPQFKWELVSSRTKKTRVKKPAFSAGSGRIRGTSVRLKHIQPTHQDRSWVLSSHPSQKAEPLFKWRHIQEQPKFLSKLHIFVTHNNHYFCVHYFVKNYIKLLRLKATQILSAEYTWFWKTQKQHCDFCPNDPRKVCSRLVQY